MAVASSIWPSASAMRIALEDTGRSSISTWAWTSTSMPSRGPSLTKQARRAGAALAEMKVVADRNAADAEALDQVMVNEILRRGSGAGLVEGHHHGAVQPGPGQQPQLVGLVGEAELRAVRAEKAARMRLEGDGESRLAMGAAHPQGRVDHGPVPQMDAVEIAHGDHGPAGDLGGRGGVSDNGKTSCHFRDSARILQGFSGERGRTVTRCPRRSQAGRVGSKRMQSGAARLTGCLTADASAWGRTAGRAGLPIFLWRKH